jgi:hypothetical protein
MLGVIEMSSAEEEHSIAQVDATLKLFLCGFSKNSHIWIMTLNKIQKPQEEQSGGYTCSCHFMTFP